METRDLIGFGIGAGAAYLLIQKALGPGPGPTPPGNVKLTVNISGEGSLKVTAGSEVKTFTEKGTMTIEEGTKVKLEVNPSSGYEIKNELNSPFIIEQDKTINVVFEPVTNYPLAVDITGKGTVKTLVNGKLKKIFQRS